MYESPINKIMTDIQSRLVEAENGELTLKVKESIGYDIDKEELVKALQYDRDQYDKGFRDAKPKWIPYSANKPSEPGEYLVSLSGCMIVGQFDGTNFVSDIRKWPFKPEAWMPLPEPYKVESEEEEC